MSKFDITAGCLQGVANMSKDGVMTVTLTSPEWCAGAYTTEPCFDEIPEDKAKSMLERIAQDCVIIKRNQQLFKAREEEYNRRWQRLSDEAVELVKSIKALRCYEQSCAISIADSMRLKRQLNSMHRLIKLRRAHLAQRLADGLGLSLPITSLAPIVNKICGVNLAHNMKYQIW